MPDIAILDTLRLYELGPILEKLDNGTRLGLVNTETEIKNIYRVLRVLRPLIEQLALLGALPDVSLDSVGRGTSLIFDNTLPDFFLRSLVEGSGITLTVSANGKEISVAAPGMVGTHDLSDDAVHLDVAGAATPADVDGNELKGNFLSWNASSGLWELSRIENHRALSNGDPDDVESPTVPQRIGTYFGFEERTGTFGSELGGRHRMRMIQSGNGITLTKAPTTNDVIVALSGGLDELSDVLISGTPVDGELLIYSDPGNVWVRQSQSALTPFINNKFRIQLADDAVGPVLEFQRERDGTPTAIVQSGDSIGQIQFEGKKSTIFDESARIDAEATQTWTSTAIGTKLQFHTTDNGSTTLDLRMTIDQDGSVDIDKGVTAETLTSDVADGTAPIVVTSTTMVANLNAESLAADPTSAKTPRNWDTVQYTKQRPLSFTDFVTAGTDAVTWLTGSIGHVLTKVATGTPPAESVVYAGQIPAAYSATPVLKWRFYNDTVQTGGDQKAVLWRVQYNSPGSSGLISAADTGTPTTTLATDQAANTIAEESLALSSVTAGDLINVTFSVDSAAGTTLAGDVVLLGVPWIEYTQAGIPDTGSAS